MSDETLFAAALDQSDPAARAAYLDSACTDPEVRRRIEALLAAHDRAGDFLARPAVSRPAPESGPTRDFAPDAEHTRTHGGTVDTDTDEALGFLAPARRPDSLGRIGHYEVLEVLGRGGFGIVFRAFDEVLQRVVAVKVLAPSMAATSPARKRFLREARSSAKVRHENVVQIHDTSRDEERLPYLVMEFIPGETLQERLDRTGPLDVAEIIRIGRQIASGLAAAHDMGLIHRDIKPSNILIDTGPQERVKITDFGLARAADDASISQSGVVAGTPMYMAPEQAKGDALDHRADLFSLGSVLYVMCTGRPPFRAESTLAVLKRVAEDDPRPIRQIIPEVPEWLCRIIEKLHAKDPAERFQSAKEVAEVLADCERQLAAHKEVTDYTRIPGGAAPAARAGLPPKSKELLAAAGALMLFAFVSMYGLSEERLLGRVFWLPVLVVGLAGVLLWAAVPRSPATAAAKAAPTRSGRWKWAGTAAALVLLACWAAWAGPFAYRYLADRGTVFLVGPVALPELDRVLVKQDGEVVATLDWIHPDVVLPPGDYELEAVAVDGHEVTKFYTETTRLFSAGMSLQRVENRPVLNLTVRRGDAITIRPMLETLAAVEKRHRDAIDPGKLDAIARSVNELHSGGFVPLFNGKDLTGWTPSPNSPGDWRVEEGALVGRQGPGYLFSAKTYENFHLRVEAKFNAAGNSGVSFRRTFQAEILNDPVCPTGTLLEVLPAKTTPLAHYPQTEIPSDTWFTLEIRADGPQISVRINDGPWVKGQDARSEVERAGPLELEVGPETVVHFRKIEIKELPPSPPSDSFAPLFNGKDTTAWSGKFPNAWSVEDGILIGRGKNGSDVGWSELVHTRSDYKDFHLRAQARINASGWAGIRVRKQKDSQKGYKIWLSNDPEKTGARTGRLDVDGGDDSLIITNPPDELRIPVDEWFTLELIARGPELVLSLNGKEAARVNDPSFAKGEIQLEVAGADTVVQFRKIEIKELPVGMTASPPAKPNPAVLQPLRDLVAATAKSRDQVKVRFEAGTVSKIDLLAAESNLDEARIRLAEAGGNRDEVIGLYDVLIAHRQEERDLIAIRVDAGAEASDSLNNAHARLADARARLAKLKPTAPAPAPRPKK